MEKWILVGAGGLGVLLGAFAPFSLGGAAVAVVSLIILTSLSGGKQRDDQEIQQIKQDLQRLNDSLALMKVRR
jgi:hypothetical protein